MRRCAWFPQQQHLDFDDLFRMATIDGARALGMETHVGSLETGKRADFAVVALRDSDMNPIEAMIRFAKPADIKATFVNGSGKVFDVANIQEDVRRIQHELRKADILIGLRITRMRNARLKRIGVYAGSFDPITIGHLWMIEQGARLFDRLIVTVGVNPDKKCTFTLDERLRHASRIHQVRFPMFPLRHSPIDI